MAGSSANSLNDPIKFLTTAQILVFHERSIRAFGGTLGMRDEAGFQAAVNHPINVHFYSGGDLFDIAAAYAFHLAESVFFGRQ
jgi:death on curing protein